MKAESNVKPQLVERYLGLVRINYDVQEEQREGMDGEKSTVYVYSMLQLPDTNMSVDALTAKLIEDKYDKATQIKMAADDSGKIELALFTANCTLDAKKILGMEPTLADVKTKKLAEISAYDISLSVNYFSLGGVSLWIDFNERARIRQSIDAYRNTGVTTMTKWFGGKSFTYPLDTWQTMLDKLSVYASEALNVTEQHKAEVQALTSIEAVESYDYKTGYPEKLSFMISEK